MHPVCTRINASIAMFGWFALVALPGFSKRLKKDKHVVQAPISKRIFPLAPTCDILNSFVSFCLFAK